MSMSIQTNVNSLIGQENLRVNNDFQARTIQRLTSGYRINSSGDDAAGLAVANKFRSDVAELTQGVRNANDGISQLQIIDGGANNISKILDRMKTLATQAASTTFSGNRATLDNEFQALKSEIDRQAANVGLNSGGRFNSAMGVYVGGGGTNQSNANVTVDLSGAANRVDSTALGVTGTSLQGGGSALGAIDLTAAASLPLLMSTTATQVFTFQTSAGQVAVTVTGTATGITGDDAVNQLNASLNSSGISAFIDSTTGILSFSSSAAFTVIAAAASSGNAVATATGAENTSMYRTTGTNAAYVNITTSTAVETITFTKGGVSKAVALQDDTGDGSGENITAALAKLNANLSGLGITALKDLAGTAITFQAAATFSITVASGATVTSGVFTADVATATTAPAAGASATANALSSMTALNNAVTNLGAVQGKIGTGQNMLSYAINLAQSQISNFSLAEMRIRDTDVAAEAANLTKAQVMQQASMAALAQANSAPQAVLALLRG